MRPILTLQLLVMLRRIWKSLERIGNIQQARLDFEMSQVAKPRSPKLAQIGRATVEDLNRSYRDRHPEI